MRTFCNPLISHCNSFISIQALKSTFNIGFITHLIPRCGTRSTGGCLAQADSSHPTCPCLGQNYQWIRSWGNHFDLWVSKYVFKKLISIWTLYFSVYDFGAETHFWLTDRFKQCRYSYFTMMQHTANKTRSFHVIKKTLNQIKDYYYII